MRQVYIMNEKLKEIQASIDKTDYWDAPILSFQAVYFGDEVELVIENDAATAWKITFLLCHSLEYTSNSIVANWRDDLPVRDMTRAQLDYCGQAITVKNSAEVEGFYEVTLDLSLLNAKIICKDISVELVDVKELDLWYSLQPNNSDC